MRILFVCLGNICRSPTAEAVFRKTAAMAGLDPEIDSAGTSDWHIGEPPYGPMQAAAFARGYDLADLRARQFSRADFDRFDLILGMDGTNITRMREQAGDASGARLQLFLDYAPEIARTDVPDPYYTRDFDAAIDLIEAASAGLLAQLLRSEQVSSAAAPQAL